MLAVEPLQGRKGRAAYGGILNQGGAETIKDANDGNLKKCIHNHPGGKGCYLCDPDHPHRLKVAAKA